MKQWEIMNNRSPGHNGLGIFMPKTVKSKKEELLGKNAYRFVNAVSDFATHARPLKERSNYRESLFGRTVDGNAMIDRAYEMVKSA